MLDTDLAIALNHVETLGLLPAKGIHRKSNLVNYFLPSQLTPQLAVCLLPLDLVFLVLTLQLGFALLDAFTLLLLLCQALLQSFRCFFFVEDSFITLIDFFFILVETALKFFVLLLNLLLELEDLHVHMLVLINLSFELLLGDLKRVLSLLQLLCHFGRSAEQAGAPSARCLLLVHELVLFVLESFDALDKPLVVHLHTLEGVILGLYLYLE